MKKLQYVTDMKATAKELTFVEKASKELTGLMEPVFIDMLKRASENDLTLVDEIKEELEKEEPEQVNPDIDELVQQIQKGAEEFQKIFEEKSANLQTTNDVFSMLFKNGTFGKEGK